MTDELGLPNGADIVVPREPRAVFTGDVKGTWDVWFVEPAAIVARIGGLPVFLAFQKCLNGANRVLTYEQAIDLSREKVGYDTPEGRRNLHVLALSLAGTMYEVGDALQDLRKAGVERLVSNVSIWEPLDSLRKRWCKQPLPSRVRNDLAFHLGDRATYELGWKKALAANHREMQMIAWGTAPRYGVFFLGAVDLTLRGIDVEAADFEKFIEVNRQDHGSFPVWLHTLFMDVLSKAGIRTQDCRAK